MKTLLFLILSILTLFLTGRALPNYWQLGQNGKQVAATIVAIQPYNHQRVSYRFEINGTEYDGSDTSFDLTKIDVGHKVQVTYLPEDPSISAIGNMRFGFLWEVVFVLIASIVLPWIVVFKGFPDRWGPMKLQK